MDIGKLTLDILQGLGRFFYFVSPAEQPASLYEVPEYVSLALPYFVFFFILEACVITVCHRLGAAKHNGRKFTPFRWNDAFASIASGLLYQQCIRLFLFPLEIHTFLYLYEFRMFTLPYNSIWTWIFAIFAIDFCYYWFHRAAHEVNLLWSIHVVHHSTEEFTLASALRQPIIQEWGFTWFYVPLALLGLPPACFELHRNLSTLFQFWYHTELIGKLGWLEYVIITPSHHRVHHGRNRYCIDKNFGGTVIWWDWLFGTFQEEREDEPVVFGITTPLKTFNPLWIQGHHFTHMCSRIMHVPGILNKFKVLCYGPGWSHEKPQLRLGDINDIPIVPNTRHDPNPPSHLIIIHDPIIPTLVKPYLFVHMIILLAFHFAFMNFSYTDDALLPSSALIASFFYVCFTLVSMATIFDGKLLGYLLESVRLAMTPLLARHIIHKKHIGDTEEVERNLMLLDLGCILFIGFVGFLAHSLNHTRDENQKHNYSQLPFKDR